MRWSISPSFCQPTPTPKGTSYMLLIHLLSNLFNMKLTKVRCQTDLAVTSKRKLSADPYPCRKGLEYLPTLCDSNSVSRVICTPFKLLEVCVECGLISSFGGLMLETSFQLHLMGFNRYDNRFHPIFCWSGLHMFGLAVRTGCYRLSRSLPAIRNPVVING